MLIYNKEANKNLSQKPQTLFEHLKRTKMPLWLDPMLATLTSKRFSDPNWTYECKLDSIWALIFKNKNKISIFSRNKIDLSKSYPELVKAVLKQSISSFIIDGEIVAFDKNVSSFFALQQRMQIETLNPSKPVPMFYYVFDILYFDQYLLYNISLIQRKKILKDYIQVQDLVRLIEYIETNGLEYYKHACENGWEGIIAKKANSTYQHKRSRDWLKFKCVKGQEFVIGGFTKPCSKRKGFGVLLIGYYEGNKLKYAGKVGTGYHNDLLINLRKQLDKIISSRCPFEIDVPKKSVTWVNPILIAEVGFSERTRAGKLRHPHFKELRSDKSANEVNREQENE